jgi:hypothetical protein
MEGFFAAPRVLEIGFDSLSAVAGLFVVAMALRVASGLTLSAHRQAMRVLAAAAVVVVASEIIGVAAALTRPARSPTPPGSSRSSSPSRPPRPCCTT